VFPVRYELDLYILHSANTLYLCVNLTVTDWVHIKVSFFPPFFYYKKTTGIVTVIVCNLHVFYSNHGNEISHDGQKMDRVCVCPRTQKWFKYK
jgi:hypothetical protein